MVIITVWISLSFCRQFFREPHRKIPPVPEGGVLSPADGRVVFVAKGRIAGYRRYDAENQRLYECLQCSSANRAPVSGKVVLSERRGGGFLNAALDKASEENERHLIVIDSELGQITCVQIAGLLARRVLCYANVGDRLEAGQRYGFIRFGSRADLYLPETFHPTVSLGDKVAAGMNCLARKQ